MTANCIFLFWQPKFQIFCRIPTFVYLFQSLPHLHQYIRRAKNGVCPGGATQNLPPQYRGVAQEVARHRDTTNFCVCVISDIYPLPGKTAGIHVVTLSFSFKNCGDLAEFTWYVQVGKVKQIQVKIETLRWSQRVIAGVQIAMI